uniref:PDZ domain-containing protein n=1 Tax=Eptatretus burgeri TaxID=7764 RepID=A0A8C4RDA4_EPTBU
MEVASSESNVSHKVYQWSPPTCHQYLCCLTKGPKGYGFTLCKNRDKPGLYVIKVKKGLPAEKAGLWNGAYIMEVNGINTKGKSIEDVGQMIATSDTTRLLVVFKDTYLCHTMCKIPRITVYLKDPLLQPLSKATAVNEKLEKSENIAMSALVKDFQAHDLEREKIIAGYDPRLEEQDEPSATKDANDIVIHCDGIDGEKQKLLFEGILQHSVELFTLKRNTMLLTCQSAEEVDRILATGEFKIDGKELHVEAWNESSFEVDAYHMKLEGLDENTPFKLVSLFIELNSGRRHLDFDVDYAIDGREAIVTFCKPIAWKVFQKTCSICKLYGRAILATPLQMTKWLCVEGFPSSTNMFTLHQYFQKEAEICGGNINRMSMEEHKQMAYLQFDSSEGKLKSQNVINILFSRCS